MEKHLLKLFQLADTLNQKQDKVYAQITYYADDTKVLDISIRSKLDFEFIERCQIQLKSDPQVKLKLINDLFDTYIRGEIESKDSKSKQADAVK